LDKFKERLDPNLRDSEVEVYIKAIMNKTVEDLIEGQKNSKDPVIIHSVGKQEIRLYLHPVKSDQ
jgi:hypothetical protein